MRVLLFILAVLIGFQAEAQFIAPFQGVQNQPKVQLDYWIYSTGGGSGLTNQYPVVPSSKTEMDKFFNTTNSNSSLITTGRTNSPRILDWQSAADLTPLGISLPNSGTYFAMKVQGTFIPEVSGNYTLTMKYGNHQLSRQIIVTK